MLTQRQTLENQFQEIRAEFLKCERYLSMHVRRLQEALLRILPSREELLHESIAAQRTVHRYARYHRIYVCWRVDGGGCLLDEASLPHTRRLCDDHVADIGKLADVILYNSS